MRFFSWAATMMYKVEVGIEVRLAAWLRIRLSFEGRIRTRFFFSRVGFGSGFFLSRVGIETLKEKTIFGFNFISDFFPVELS